MQKLIPIGLFVLGFGLGFIVSPPKKTNRSKDQQEISFSVFVPWKDLKDKVQVNELHGKFVRLSQNDCAMMTRTKLFSNSDGVTLRGKISELASLGADFEMLTRPLTLVADQSGKNIPCKHQPKVQYGDEL